MKEALLKKAATIKALLEELDPNMQCNLVEQTDGSQFLCGPFPSFIVTLGVPEQEDGYVISVNADAPTMTYFILELTKVYPDLVHWGAYAEALDGNGVTIGEGAYDLREQHIVANAMHIIKARNVMNMDDGSKGLIVPPEKKIILAGG